jgi:UDP-N-acetylglucosamine 2-epimerase (non-hydrolysing)
MIDSLFFHMKEAEKSNILVRLGLQKNPSRISPYALLTLHRPSNADDQGSLTKILKGLEVISKRIPILFPVHPRTRKQLSAFGLQDKILFRDVRSRAELGSPGFYGMDPLGYLDFVKLMVHSKLIFTDSGGIQEEAMVLNIPCLTLRNTTERPVTITHGTNILVWNDTQKIIREASKVLTGKTKKAKIPALWDGKTAERIIKILAEAPSRPHEKS